MENKPTARAIMDATAISQPYASMILTGKRQPSRSLAIRIMRETSWRHECIAGLTDAQIDMLEQIEPWTPVGERAA